MTTKLRAASFQDGAVTTAKIASNAITNAKIADGAIDSDAIGSLAITNAKLAADANKGRPNIAINGAMQIAQRGTSQASITTAGYYTVDRFYMNINDAGTWTQSQQPLATTHTPFLNGFTMALKLQCTSSATPAANGTCQINYRIEGRDLQHFKTGSASPEKMTVSFWIKATKTGTNVIGSYQDEGGKSTGQTYTINASDTWEYKTITFPGNTHDAIANDTTRGRQITWYFSAGSNRQSGTLQSTWENYAVGDEAPGQVNHADSTSNSILITGVQIELGENATDFEHRSFGEELGLCQRYFYQAVNGTAQAFGMGTYYAGHLITMVLDFPVTMRNAPTVTVGTGTNYYVSYTNGQGDSFDTWDNVQRGCPNYIALDVTHDGASGTAGDGCALATQNASAFINVDAEI